MNLGYCCINQTLRKKDIFTGRTMRLATFESKGLSYVSELALANTRDLIEIIKWNHDHEIFNFRVGSELFPWWDKYEFEDLPDWPKIRNLLVGAGKLAKKYDQRLTFHPGPYNVLVSPKENVVNRCIRELSNHAKIFDIMGLSRTPYNLINIHLGGSYGDKEAAINRFIAIVDRLPESVRSRLTIENDDKSSLYSVTDLVRISKLTNIPVVFDFHHHKCYGDIMPEKTALELAMSTWPDNIKPLVHISNSRKIYEDSSVNRDAAHSDYLYEFINLYDYDVDVDVEAKAKELAVLKYREDYLSVH